MFAYCNNNPTNNSDPKGTFVNTITGALVGGIIGGISALMSKDNFWAGVGVGAATGALAGATADIAIATGGVGAIAIAAIGGSLASGANYAATEAINGRTIDGGELAVEMSVGAVANALTFGAGGGTLKKVGGKVIKNMANSFSTTFLKGTAKAATKSASAVIKRVTTNAILPTAETAVISFGAWLNAQKWRALVR